jgi:hypothetical protein
MVATMLSTYSFSPITQKPERPKQLYIDKYQLNLNFHWFFERVLVRVPPAAIRVLAYK